MTENKTSYQNTRDLFRSMNSKNIVYNKAYYKLTDSLPGAILLSHLAYLWSEVFGCKEFYQSDEQLYRTLGFSERTLRTAKSHTQKYLSSRKIGTPAKNHWIVNEDVLIADLVSLQCVMTSPVENVMTGADENVSTGSVETVATKNEELQKKELQKNNSNDVVEKLFDSGNELVPRQTLKELLEKYGEAKVREQLTNLRHSNGIHNPPGWLKDALERNYVAIPLVAKQNLTPPSYEVWSDKLQAKRNAEREKLSDPNDWRERAIKEQLNKLQKQETI